ncbi:hypothetical protein CYMTET_30578, partial [Cymbomonas tetramitiformis]
MTSSEKFKEIFKKVLQEEFSKNSAEKKKSLCIFLNAQGAECEVGEEGALHDQQASSDDAHPPKGNRTAEEELEIYISKVLPLKNGEKYETKQKALSI